MQTCVLQAPVTPFARASNGRSPLETLSRALCQHRRALRLALAPPRASLIAPHFAHSPAPTLRLLPLRGFVQRVVYDTAIYRPPHVRSRRTVVNAYSLCKLVPNLRNPRFGAVRRANPFALPIANGMDRAVPKAKALALPMLRTCCCSRRAATA